MLKVIHKYQRSIVAFLISGIVCFSMLGFGVDFFMDRNAVPAVITIGDTEVTSAQFRRERQAIEARYRQQFGPNYPQLLDSFGINLDNQAVDQIVPKVVLNQVASEYGMYASPAEVKKEIKSALPGAFTPEGYVAFLRAVGMSAGEFESEVSKDKAREQLIRFVSLMAVPSEAELRSRVERDKTELTVRGVLFAPKEFEASVLDPGDEALEEYYNENSLDYEIAPRVAYDYVTFLPADYQDKVEIFPEDAELYYDEHQSEYRTKAKANVSEIFLSFANSASEEEKEARKELADKLVTELREGADFSEYVTKYSDDVATKFSGGSLGEIEEGSKEHDEIASVIFSGVEEGILDPIVKESGVHIVQVTNLIPSGRKAFSEVEKEIEKKLRERDAPGIATEMAYSALERFQSSSKSLMEFVRTDEETVGKGESLENSFAAGEDPNPELTGLSAEALSLGKGKHIVELPNAAVLVSVREVTEADLPGFSAVREKVLSDYRRKEAPLVAEKKAEEFVAKLGAVEGELSSEEYDKVVAEFNGKTIEEQKFILAEGPKEDLRAPMIQKALSGVTKAQLLDEPFLTPNGQVVVDVRGVQKPKKEAIEKALSEYEAREKSRAERELLDSLVNTWKSERDVQIML